ncbi:MAG: ABC transporter permease [Spirulinaceae cyanobacterium RM2_2_10]|nr:ABC transporter permease [Spirulinaceae cyanobacterium SM2_1_0]NJO20526.1 ABC transporter permease [Spirulinaceae cyanobacterium RM2_2_10]
MVKTWKQLQTYLLVTPQTLVFLLFLLFPLLTIFVVSFWEFNGYAMSPALILGNYKAIFTPVYLATYLNTFKFTVIVWGLALAIAYPVAYFLAFHIHDLRWQIGLFVLCTIPFFTSNIIRMISWIPFLGREGILNQVLLNLGIVQAPVDIFLYSDFAVVLAMLHLYTLFMVVPIFNSLVRIDRDLIAAALDSGASGLQVFKEVVLPLSLPGIAIGSIFIVTLVMGEFTTVRLMSGGQASSVGSAIRNQIGSLQYPQASANAVILLLVTLAIVVGIMRTFDIRKEL